MFADFKKYSVKKGNILLYSLNMMKLILTVLIVFTTFLVQAQTIANTPCPNLKGIRGICMLIDSKEKAINPQGRYVYKYQQKLLEAACANPAIDSEEEIGKKVSAMMKQFNDKLICNNTKFDVANGNIIKFAANLKFNEFIIDMCIWKVDFNKIDEMDGRTVLDYIKVQIGRNEGMASEPVLQRYYDMIRKAGGRHKNEL